jgi:Xaa-Pro aminopeptidase
MPNGELVFGRDEYRQRMDVVRKNMRDRGVDVLLVDEAESLMYLTGWGTSASMYQVCVVPLDHEPIMLLRRLDEPAFLEGTWLSDHVAFADWEDPIAVLARTLDDRGWSSKRLGVDLASHYLPVRRFEAIKAALPAARCVDFSGVLWEARLRKSPHEIAYLRQAAKIADTAMLEAIAAVGEGRSEREAAAVAARAFVAAGADHGQVGPITSGARSGSLHGRLRNHRLAPGEIVHMEITPRVHGYSARLMRPTVVGRPSADQIDTARRLIEVQDQQIAAMKPGVISRDIDHACRAGVLAAGMRALYDNITGYTLGYYADWGPRASDFTRIFLPTSEWVLESGMVFHMYTSARGMAFSETVLVTENGAERLTRCERKLFAR